MEVSFTILGNPIGKERHRTSVLPNGKIHTYNSKKNTNYERFVKSEYKRQCGNIYFVGELDVELTIYFPIPKSFNKKNRESALMDEVRPQTKPDIDNCSKIILDALNGVAFEDDKSVVDLAAHKYYSSVPCVEVIINGDYVTV